MKILEEHTLSFNVRELIQDIKQEFVQDAVHNNWYAWGFSWFVDVESRVNNQIQGMLEPLADRLLFPNITVKRVHYTSVDSTGKRSAKLSALLIIPDTKQGQPSMPIMGFQHGTIIDRAGAPSQFSLTQPLKTPEAVLGMVLAALNGYVVAMADYPGLGDDTDNIQPFVSAQPLAQSVIDLLHSTKAYLQEQPLNRWNGEVYLTGYSQGGYVTMSVAKAISDDAQLMEQLPVKATAPCAGPYSLSNAMRFLMLREERFVEGGHFILMAIRGFNATYGDEFGDGIFSKEGALRPEYFKLWDLADGNHTAEEVHEHMPAIPRDCLSPRLIAELSNPESPAFKTLAANDLVELDPKMPLQMYHSPSDDMVPFQNSEIAYEHITKLKPSVALSPDFYIPLGTLVHVEAAVPSLLSAYAWLNTFRNRHKQTLAPGEFIHGGKNVFSKDKKYCIRYQLDGNLAFYDMSDISLLWRADVKPSEHGTGKCIMQPEDGNLVVYDANDNPTWASGTNGNPDASFVIGEQGQLTINDVNGNILKAFV
jgi:pimeloyl-ACP methyl ester carboxylesterase